MLKLLLYYTTLTNTSKILGMIAGHTTSDLNNLQHSTVRHTVVNLLPTTEQIFVAFSFTIRCAIDRPIRYVTFLSHT